MIYRWTLVFLFSGLSLSAAQTPTKDMDCFTVHGRICCYNGTPSVRIWVPATHRLLGLDPDGLEALPPELQKALGKDCYETFVWGDFKVCPLQKDIPGHMRLVSIQSVKILKVISRL